MKWRREERRNKGRRERRRHIEVDRERQTEAETETKRDREGVPCLYQTERQTGTHTQSAYTHRGQRVTFMSELSHLWDRGSESVKLAWQVLLCTRSSPRSPFGEWSVVSSTLSLVCLSYQHIHNFLISYAFEFLPVCLSFPNWKCWRNIFSLTITCVLPLEYIFLYIYISETPQTSHTSDVTHLRLNSFPIPSKPCPFPNINK